MPFKNLLATRDLPDLGPVPRTGTLPLGELNQKLDAAFQCEKLAPERAFHMEPLVRALVLLWHDHLDASHAISQDIETPDGNFLHGMMHRREPDYGNAKYWFRRIGAHPSLAELGRRVSPSLEPVWREKLVVQGRWDPCAFVDLCEAEAAHAAPSHGARLLRELQQIEFDVLLERFLAPPH